MSDETTNTKIDHLLKRVLNESDVVLCDGDKAYMKFDKIVFRPLERKRDIVSSFFGKIKEELSCPGLIMEYYLAGELVYSRTTNTAPDFKYGDILTLDGLGGLIEIKR